MVYSLLASGGRGLSRRAGTGGERVSMSALTHSSSRPSTPGSTWGVLFGSMGIMHYSRYMLPLGILGWFLYFYVIMHDEASFRLRGSLDQDPVLLLYSTGTALITQCPRLLAS